MLNSKAFKKLAALTAAVALVGSFAVSASAAVVTTTEYFGEGQIKVAVKVTELASDAEVTYYAEKDSKPYHVDQAKAVSGTATFDTFVTSEANLNATVLVNGANDKITGRTVSYGGQVVKTIPNADTTVAKVTVTKTLAANETIKKVTATNADAEYVAGTEANTYNVTLTNIKGDVVIDFETEITPEEIDNSTGEHIATGVVALENGGYRITVLGKVSGLKEGAAFGAEIDTVKFASKIANPENGYFAIQVEGSELTKTSYSTGVYYTKADDSVVVDYADAQ